MKLKHLCEMQDWRNHSGNRSKSSKLLQQIDKLDTQLMNASSKKVRAWDEYVTKVLPKDSPYWSEVSDSEIHSAIQYAQKLLQTR